jgi:hypothetical protein
MAVPMARCMTVPWPMPGRGCGLTPLRVLPVVQVPARGFMAVPAVSPVRNRMCLRPRLIRGVRPGPWEAGVWSGGHAPIIAARFPYVSPSPRPGLRNPLRTAARTATGIWPSPHEATALSGAA